MISVSALGRATFSRLAGDFTFDVAMGLLRPGGHSLLDEQRRSGLIISRVRLIAFTFSILTPLWMVIDLLSFEPPIWKSLAVLRAGVTVAFALVAFGIRNSEDIRLAQRALLILQLIPTVFYLLSLWLLDSFQSQGLAGMVASGYAFLPFVMVAGLSIFPITLIEGILYSLPMVIALAVSAVGNFPMLPFNSYLGALWLLLLLCVAATLSGMSQLHFMMELVHQAARDLLTKAYTRRVGEELLELLYISVARSDAPMAVAFVDLDNFKSINDSFGHEEGDRTLRRAAEALRQMLRRNDVLIRWGGEEFLVIMPFTDCEGARKAVHRLRSKGLGVRPDGRAQTASIGIAERMSDFCAGWSALVEQADRRMYAAKQGGKDRVVLCGEEVLLLESGGASPGPRGDDTSEPMR
ncbi:MAG: diguanylate cyclase [Alphaproteobacteria bacterium]